jgi:hypothetical protein
MLSEHSICFINLKKPTVKHLLLLVKITIIALLLIGAAACGEKDPTPIPSTTELSLNFKATYNGQPLLINQYYDYVNGQKINFFRSQFYIANITLVKASGNIVIKDADYINFSGNTDLVGAQKGQVVICKNIPMGEYTGIKIGIGLPPTVNATKPESYRTDNVLSQSSEYWQSWKSYIFTKTEGKLDINKDGKEDFTFGYHTGGDAAYRIVDIPQRISLNGSSRYENTIKIDVKKLLMRTDGTFLDITKKQTTHELADTTYSNYLMNNFKNAMTFE